MFFVLHVKCHRHIYLLLSSPPLLTLPSRLPSAWLSPRAALHNVSEAGGALVYAQLRAGTAPLVAAQVRGRLGLGRVKP